MPAEVFRETRSQPPCLLALPSSAQTNETLNALLTISPESSRYPIAWLRSSALYKINQSVTAIERKG